MVSSGNEVEVWEWGTSRRFRDAKKHSETEDVQSFPTGIHLQLAKRRIVYGQTGFRDAEDSILHRKPFSVVTGLKTGRRLHYGTKCVLDQVRWYWEHGANVHIALSDIESWTFNHIPVFEASQKALAGYVLDCLTVLLGDKGFDREGLGRIHVYSQWARKEIAYLTIALLSFLSDEDINRHGTFADLLFPLVVGADILHVQLRKFGGTWPVVVPVGVDQTDFLNEALLVMERYREEIRPDFGPPSFTFHRMLPGIDGEEMSAARAKSALFLNEDRDNLELKLERLVETEPPKGRPADCVVFDLQRFTAANEELVRRMYVDCLSGKAMCSNCASVTLDLLTEVGHRFSERRAALEKDEMLVDFLVRQDILRPTEAVTEITSRPK